MDVSQIWVWLSVPAPMRCMTLNKSLLPRTQFLHLENHNRLFFLQRRIGEKNWLCQLAVAGARTVSFGPCTTQTLLFTEGKGGQNPMVWPKLAEGKDDKA